MEEGNSRDPNDMTVNELKSKIAEYGFEAKIPQNERKTKAYFVGVYKEFVLPLIEKERKARRRSDPAQLQALVSDSTPLPKTEKRDSKRAQTMGGANLAALAAASRKPKKEEAIQTIDDHDLHEFPKIPRHAIKQEPPSRLTPTVLPPSTPIKKETVPASTFSGPISYPSPQSFEVPHSSFVPIEERPVLASTTPPRSLQQQKQGAGTPTTSRPSTPATSKPSTPSTSGRSSPVVGLGSTPSKKRVEVSEEFYPSEEEEVEDEIAEEGGEREYRSPFLQCVKVSVVVMVIASLLAVCLFLLPSVSRIGFIAEGLEGIFNMGTDTTPYYCNTGTLPSPIPSRPDRNCTRCPQYAICSFGEYRCGNGYVPERLRAGGKVVERCVRDEEEVRHVHELKEKMRSTLSEHAGAHDCDPETVPDPTMPQDALRDKLYTEYVNLLKGKKEDPTLNRSFDKLYYAAIKDLLAQPEWGVFLKDGVWSTKERNLPFLCDMKVRLWELKWYFLFSLLVAAAIEWLVWRVSTKKAKDKEVEILVEEVKNLLVQQKEASEASNHRIPSYLPLIHLRDTLFHDDPKRKKYSTKERTDLWARVIKSMGEDRRIRNVPHMVEGEQQSTWEWVSRLVQS